MNNHNLEGNNQSWRGHNYLEESRKHGLSRSQNYFSHYPSPQFVNDYLHTTYVYPNIPASYRMAEYYHPPINQQFNDSLRMMTPQDYSKYYNKVQGQAIHEQRPTAKEYPNANNFFEQHHNYRNQTPYISVPLQNDASFAGIMAPVTVNSPFQNESKQILQKSLKNKGVIVIESKEQNNKQIDMKMVQQTEKVEEKATRLLLNDFKFESKKNSYLMETEQKKDLGTKPRNGYSVLSNLNTSQKEAALPTTSKQLISMSIPQLKFPEAENLNLQKSQLIPILMIDQLQNEILQELQNSELPDSMMKLFIKYKTLEAKSNYHENKQMSEKVFNSLKLYREIIEFEKQRKSFIDHIFSENILEEINSSFPSKLFPFKSKNFSFLNKKHKFDPKNEKEKNARQQSLQNLKQKEYSEFIYPNKTKKISKRQIFDQVFQQDAFNSKTKLIDKQQIQSQQNVSYQRKLRDRKKKKNKKEKYERLNQQRSSKNNLQKSKDLNKSKNQKFDDKKSSVLFSNDDEGLIEKIRGWAEKTVLTDVIESKQKKIEKSKNLFSSQNISQNDFSKVNKNDQTVTQNKKSKQRSTKSSESAFKSMLNEKISESKANKESGLPNLITFSTSNSLSQVQKEDFQKQLNQLIKQLKNNDNHGKIRIGKEYYQAKMPNFIKSDKELSELIEEKRIRLQQRKMSVLTF